ncbi:class II glutamine amidotransferase [Thermomonospora cellulosilytica]|uniref:Asparagine synthetase B (Glutamine-hydrolyzing) n=1 Tax=Thermomonospora cellulosilytica TaxID=1411118 RepID=A0A7W3RAL8_9ACTN|nr:hypothetical protein [Thermomonospora cellulosilytica]MBA9005971.1 asparagine synthetase B (glutamine-hydrolyzing) [Thermomonospora cellulosilytica]
MCGIFAYLGPARPDPDLLEAAATAAASRGPHGHGWATSASTTRHEFGPLPPAAVRDLTDRAVIGHARLATTGDYRDRTGLQPVAAGGHWLAHNGTVRNWRTLTPDAASDSVALAELYAHHRRQLDGPHALRAALADADTAAWALLVLDVDGSLVVWRRGLPLWQHRHPTGLYLASRRFHPDAAPVPEDTICQEHP